MYNNKCNAPVIVHLKDEVNNLPLVKYPGCLTLS